MGKTTCYHPVSLHVIRGSAEWIGFKFGKIRQLDSDLEQNWARYEAEIIEYPKPVPNMHPSWIEHDLRSAFCEDIKIHWVHFTKSGKLMCQIDVTLSKQPVPNNELVSGSELGWLNDDPEDSTTIEGW